MIDAGLRGIITRTDVLCALYHLPGSLGDIPVTEPMSGDVVTTTATTAVTTALRTMEEHGVKKLPVLEDVDVTGIVTMTDIARHQPNQVREARETMDRKDEWTD